VSGFVKKPGVPECQQSAVAVATEDEKSAPRPSLSFNLDPAKGRVGWSDGSKSAPGSLGRGEEQQILVN
jgi:hypothetical protein